MPYLQINAIFLKSTPTPGFVLIWDSNLALAAGSDAGSAFQLHWFFQLHEAQLSYV